MFSRSNVFDELWSALYGLEPIFDDLSRRRLEGRRSEFVPPAEWFTRDKNLVVSVELPGVDPKDVEVTVAQDLLTIRGEKKQVRKTGEGVLRFERSFTLPDGVNT